MEQFSLLYVIDKIILKIINAIHNLGCTLLKKNAAVCLKNPNQVIFRFNHQIPHAYKYLR